VSRDGKIRTPIAAATMWKSRIFTVVKRRHRASRIGKPGEGRGRVCTRVLARAFSLLIIVLTCSHGAALPSWRSRAPPCDRFAKHSAWIQSSMFARKSDAVSARLGRCAIHVVCAAGTSRVTRRASRILDRPHGVIDVLTGAFDTCATAIQCTCGQPRPVSVCLSVAWRQSGGVGGGGGSGSGGGGNDLTFSKQLVRGVRVGPRGSRRRPRRELASSSNRRCASAAASAAAAVTAIAAAAATARAARTR